MRPAYLVLALVLSIPLVAAPAQAGVTPGLAEEYSRRFMEQRAARERVNDAQDDALRGAIGGAPDHINDGLEVIESLQELVDAYEALSDADRDLDPNLRPAGAPGVPVSCTAEECGQCYDAAQAALHAALLRLEKLRILYTRTTDFAEKAISFGDTTSGLHAVSGLAWQKAKKDIEASVESLNGAFDAKKPELMGRLKAALDEIGECEAKHFANPDWYNRFGFMYYETMNAKTIRAE